MTSIRTVTIGTAGHVDHGKSSLVRALTGTDPDRLKEEQERGITIDLGFAHLARPGGLVLSFVDVPGHERFVRNMVAGAAGIDVVLLVVAADESVMPQTREHLDICRLLGAATGVVALTKSDLADADTLGLVRLEVQDLVRGTFLEGAPIVDCSATTRAGLDDLAAELSACAARAPARAARGPFRLPVDRAFTLHGFGTVVTGTARSGSVRAGDEMELLPAGERVRVRSVQVHGAPAAEGRAGERVALNLGGVERREVERGDVVATPGGLVTTSVLDVRVELLEGAPELRDLARVRLHLGTAEVMARLRWAGAPGDAEYYSTAQLRLERPIVAAAGDRFILRRYSPVSTLGGGVVVSPRPGRKIGPKDAAAAARMTRLGDAVDAGDGPALLAGLVESAGGRAVSEAELAAWTGQDAAEVRETLALAEGRLALAACGESPRRWMPRAAFDAAAKVIADKLEAFHRAQPLVLSHPKDALRSPTGLDEAAFAAVLAELARTNVLKIERDAVSLRSHEIRLSPEEAAARERIVAAFDRAGLSPPDLPQVVSGGTLDATRAQRIVRLLLGSGELVKLPEGMLVSGRAMAALLEDMASFRGPGQELSVTDFKERTGVSRKYAIPLLEYLDQQGYTRRTGDGRTWTGPSPKLRGPQ
jgi:selenocysteine-specific elongation factor